MSATLHLAEQLIALPLGHARRRRLPGARRRPPRAARLRLHVAAVRPRRRARQQPVGAPARQRADGKLLVFAGHTDVVPTGPLAAWSSDPFVPTRRDGKLYGRGAADMKSSIAAMVVAAEEFVAAHARRTPAAIALLITSDEEGPSRDGTARVCDWLAARGDPARLLRRRRADLGATRSATRSRTAAAARCPASWSIRGVQGHIAYPQLANNPIHLAAPLLAELVGVEWDRGNAHFPPTSWQMSNIHAGTGAGNVIPGELVVDFNFRFSTESTPASRCARVLEAIVARHGVEHEIAWTLGGEPFLTPPGALSDALARRDPRRSRRRDRALDHRRHVRRPLHREDLRAGGRVRPGQREHPPDRRARRDRQPRRAEERLPLDPRAAACA